ncbi:anthrax toxin lethal factor-related metalloendopeptidase [Peribacillus alkalitolerans]|uniref:anthrax toxin lethal factor-related metalloendopeptidase n=1 Tax=Peribacillus alkalitolerans TaxID=1550385 RepID=UPI001F071A00|nr:toxin [Peribacillus alkalitolerans]
MAETKVASSRKKINKFQVTMLILFCMVAFLFYTTIFASHDGKTYRSLPLNHALKKDGIFKEKPALQKLFLFPEESFDASEVEWMATRISHLPPNMLKRLNDREIKIKVFNGSLTEQKEATHLSGIKPRGYKKSGVKWDRVPGMGGNKIVFVKIGASEMGKGHGSVNLELHELAHTIDRLIYDNIRYKEEFLRIWKKEAPLFFNGRDYFIKYPEEYFAEVFSMYYLNETTNQELKNGAPLTYNYIKNLN